MVLTQKGKKMPEKNDWVSIRNAWESGVSKNQVAKDFGVSVTAVTAQQKKEGWTRQPEAESVGTPATVDLSEHPLVESHDKVAELEAEIARLKAEVQGQKREAHIPMLDTAEQVLAFYGYDRLANIAAKRINRERKQDGFTPYDFSEEDSLKVRGMLKRLQQHAKLVVITDGAAGAFATNGIDMFTAVTRNVKVGETTGAGDAFASGVVAGLIERNDLAWGLKCGLAQSESVIKYVGAKNKLLSCPALIKAAAKHTVRVEAL